jgi:hypothetical protein
MDGMLLVSNSVREYFEIDENGRTIFTSGFFRVSTDPDFEVRLYSDGIQLIRIAKDCTKTVEMFWMYENCSTRIQVFACMPDKRGDCIRIQILDIAL